MKVSHSVRIALLFGLLLVALAAILVIKSGRAESHSASTSLPDLEYLKAINSVGPPQDPQLLFLLMTQYANANRQGEGAEFFSARLKEFEPKLTPVQKSLYLGIIGLLRAQHASSVPLLRRYGYVKETIAILDQAKQFSGGKVFVVNWIAGIVHTEIPGYFRQRKAAQRGTAWCLEHAIKRLIRHGCAKSTTISRKLAHNDGEQQRHRIISGVAAIPTFDHPITLATPFSEDRASGHAFAPRRITEVVPGRVYALSGFEFTEYYFVVSKDGHNSSALTRARARISQKVHTKRCKPLRQDCRR